MFLQNDWAQFVKDGWLVCKGLCKIFLFLKSWIIPFLSMLILVASNRHLHWGVTLTLTIAWGKLRPGSQWWYPVPTLVSGEACDCVLAWDWGAALVGTLVGIDSLSPRLAWEIYFFTHLLLFYFPDHPNCLFNMLLATQFRVYCLQYILLTCTLLYKCLYKHLFTRRKPNLWAKLSWLNHILLIC